MSVYANQSRPEVPPEREGYVRYVLSTDADVPHGAPIITEHIDGEGKPYKAHRAVTSRFHRAGEVVEVHKDFPAAKSWRPYEPPKET
jgi:hypothetical protein